MSSTSTTFPLSAEHAAAAKLEKDSFSGDARQDDLNRVFDAYGADTALDFIRDNARSAHRLYPQYEGEFDGAEWRLGRMRRGVATKGGERFAAGDVVMFKAPFDGWDYAVSRHATAYSVRGGIAVEIWRHDVEASDLR